MRPNLREGSLIVAAPYGPIAERLEKVREAYGLTQSEFARRIGVAPHTFNGWLKGDKRPGIDTALVIRREFSVSLDYLYAGDASTLSVKLHHAIRHSVPLSKL